MTKKNKNVPTTPLPESRVATDRRSGRKASKKEAEHRSKKLGRRSEDALAAKIHVISLSIVLTLLALHGLVILFHQFMPELFV